MTTVLLIRLLSIVGVGIVTGLVVNRQLKKNEDTARYSKVAAIAAALLAGAGFAGWKYYAGTL
jgi:predicted regulator of Ras-like GTPase activity (Roadblock/LC7/MglB family)